MWKHHVVLGEPGKVLGLGPTPHSDQEHVLGTGLGTSSEVAMPTGGVQGGQFVFQGGEKPLQRTAKENWVHLQGLHRPCQEPLLLSPLSRVLPS